MGEVRPKVGEVTHEYNPNPNPVTCTLSITGTLTLSFLTLTLTLGSGLWKVTRDDCQWKLTTVELKLIHGRQVLQKIN